MEEDLHVVMIIHKHLKFSGNGSERKSVRLCNPVNINSEYHTSYFNQFVTCKSCLMLLEEIQASFFERLFDV